METQKTNQEVLAENAEQEANTTVNAGEFAQEAGEVVTSSTTADTTEARPTNDPKPPVDISNLPTEGFGMDDFEAVSNGVPKEKKDETQQTKENTQKSSTNTTEKQQTQQTTVAKPTQQQQQRQNIPRDYSGFAPEEVEKLKKMSNDAFAWVTPILKERANLGAVIKQKDDTIAQLKTGKQILPDSYYEHPQAFVLTEEFGKISQDLNMASQYQSHWQRQLANIRKGDEWTDLVDNGKGQVSQIKKPATAEAEAEVLTYLQYSVNQVSDMQRRMGALQHGFTERHNNAIKQLQEGEKKYYGVYDDPKHPYQGVIKNVKEAIPVEFRSHPLASILAKSVAAGAQYQKAYEMMKAKVAELEKGVKSNATQVSQAQAKAGPTKDSVASNGGGTVRQEGNKSGTDINDFFKRMEEGE